MLFELAQQFRPVQKRFILLPSSAIAWDEERFFTTEQKYQYDKAYALGNRFTTVIMLKEQVRTADDAVLQRLLGRVRRKKQDKSDPDLLNSSCYRKGTRIPWETRITVITPLNRNRWSLNLEGTGAFQKQRGEMMHIFISEHKWKDGEPSKKKAVKILIQGDDSGIPVPAVLMHTLRNGTPIAFRERDFVGNRVHSGIVVAQERLEKQSEATMRENDKRHGGGKRVPPGTRNKQQIGDAKDQVTPENNGIIMKLKFKVQTTSLDKQASNRKDQALASRLTFVNVDCPMQIKSEATQRKIRRHVMKDIGRSRRRDAVHSPSTGQSAITVSRSLPHSIPSYWGDVKVCINFQRLFWAMDMVSEGLLALAMADSAHDFRERLDMNLDDTLQQKRQPDQAGSLDAMEQYTESLSLVRKSIVAPESRVNRHVIIGTIICLAVFDMRVRNRERWTMHMKGLDKVVQLGGGVEALDSCPPVRQSLFMRESTYFLLFTMIFFLTICFNSADVLGSLVDDAPPRFQLPRHSCSLPCAKQSDPHRAQRLLASSQIFQLTSSLDETAIVVIDSALNSASQLATLLNHMWNANRMTLDLLIPLCTLAHNVLSLPRMTNYIGPNERKQEAMLRMTPVCAAVELVRISVLALLSNVITTTSGDNLYCAAHRRSHVRQLLMQCESKVWAGWAELKLWVLIIQILMEAGSARLWFMDEIMNIMSCLSLQSWDDLMSCLRQVVWVEKAAIQEVTQLRCDIEARLTGRTRA
ncbi:hypothetical protein DL764_003245 [Monosporascus ibericus]|uniref:Uncharacterized protein n=1 Tax=Monosporascus ibericus TaxID=155417 RepID=A0A4V1XBH5_9PEZI|nr:hypothetical protein DL764_003245 [Monosporascus ibericus]